MVVKGKFKFLSFLFFKVSSITTQHVATAVPGTTQLSQHFCASSQEVSCDYLVVVCPNLATFLTPPMVFATALWPPRPKTTG